MTSSCKVELLHFHMADPRHVNQAFWRTCSFLLGSVLSAVFKDDNCVTLHSFPAPNGRTVATSHLSALFGTSIQRSHNGTYV